MTIVERRTALTMSAAPANASATRAGQSEEQKPNQMTAKPHAAADTATPMPIRRTRCNQPESNVAPSAPT